MLTTLIYNAIFFYSIVDFTFPIFDDTKLPITEGNQRTMQVNFVTMNMTFAVAASDAARALQLGDYKNYVWKNSKGEVLDFDKQCTSQGVYHSSTVTVYK